MFLSILLTALIAILCAGLLTWRIKPERYPSLGLYFLPAAFLFWGVFGVVMIRIFWQDYYSRILPVWFIQGNWIDQPGLLFFLIGLEYTIICLVLGWLADRIARRIPLHPIPVFLLLGGLESIPEHLLGIYGMRILEKTPRLEGISPIEIMLFAIPEYMLYWGSVIFLAVILAALIHWILRLLNRPRSKSQERPSSEPAIPAPHPYQSLLQSHLDQTAIDGAAPRVANLRPMRSGWESEMYAFELDGQPWILRLYAGEGGYAKCAREFNGIQRLAQAGYPVPAVSHLERDHTPFGKPFIFMERLPGRSLWNALFDAYAVQGLPRLQQFAELYVRLHRFDWRPFVDDPTTLEASGILGCVDAWLDNAHQVLAANPSPIFTPVLDWLIQRRQRLPDPRASGQPPIYPWEKPAVIHGDFHAENILIADDGRLTVIDWTNIEVSDPRFDLAWTLLLAESYEGVAWRNRLLTAYERQAGAPVPDMDFFDVAACARRIASIYISLAASPEAMGMRPEAAAMMTSPANLRALKRVTTRMTRLTGIPVPDLGRENAKVADVIVTLAPFLDPQTLGDIIRAALRKRAE